MNARYFVVAIGRFASADTIVPNHTNPQSYNRYSYTYNNPVRHKDPSGHCPGNTVCIIGSGSNAPSRVASRHYYSMTYGYFDVDHIRAEIGRVRNVMQQLEGGTQVRIAGNFGKGSASGVAYYYSVSEQLTPEQQKAAVLGIIMNYERRIENLQGVRDLVKSPGTGYSIEDLPSDYLGAYIGLNSDPDTNPEDAILEMLVFLGATNPVKEVPHPKEEPVGIMLTEDGSLAVPAPVRNLEFTPLVETEDGWQNIPWPADLQMMPIDSSSGLWQYNGSGFCVRNRGDCSP